MAQSSNRKRLQRFEGQGHLHELTFSCQGRRQLLRCEVSRKILSRHLTNACVSENFGLVAFVFMPEHVHLLVLPQLPQAKTGRLLARLKQPASKDIKELLLQNGSPLVDELTVEERSGKNCFRFWQAGAGFDRNIYSASALEASLNYIHMNPVTRRLCQKCTDWKWSSARYYLSGIIDPDLPPITHVESNWLNGFGEQYEAV
ncbi:MAG: transposase [Planctomycetota bacterium]|nr:transposase [Planctomycetota bacterium]